MSDRMVRRAAHASLELQRLLNAGKSVRLQSRNALVTLTIDNTTHYDGGTVDDCLNQVAAEQGNAFPQEAWSYFPKCTERGCWEAKECRGHRRRSDAA